MALWHLEGSLDETKTIIKTPITHFPFTIGRSTSLDMVVLHSGISREHAEIYKKGNRLYIRDLDSTNGTFVNKQPINSDTLVAHNTIIHFSHVVFKLIDLEYKPQSDLHLTRIINIANAPKPKHKASKNLGETKPKSIVQKSTNDKKPSVPANILKEQKEVISNENAKPINVDESLAPNTKAPFPKKSATPPPSYLANERIFIQGGTADSNRRLHSRREAHWPAKVSLKNQELVKCMTKDFSEKGLALKSPINIQVSTLIRVSIEAFYKGRNKQVTFIGVVKHSLITADGFSIGVQLKQCSKECHEFICDFSNHRI